MNKLTITNEAYEVLADLYLNQLVANKFNLDEEELEVIGLLADQLLEQLDELEVPWAIQNGIVRATAKPENWQRHNKDVIDEAIKKCSN